MWLQLAYLEGISAVSGHTSNRLILQSDAGGRVLVWMACVAAVGQSSIDKGTFVDSMLLPVPVVPNVDAGLLPKRPPPEPKALVVAEVDQIYLFWFLSGWYSVGQNRLNTVHRNIERAVKKRRGEL